MTAQAWESWKLSHAYDRIGSGTTPTTSDARYYAETEGMPWVTTAELREKYISSTQQQVTQEALDDFSALRVYRPGSVMMAMYGATIGRLGMTEVAATCNQACCVFEVSEQFDNRFLFYWLWHRRDDLIALSVGGGQPNLSQQDLREERALCPPLDTQRRIAWLLDEKTARIDRLIENKRALVHRLAEKREVLITRAVTKGLRPDTPMKPSSIDSLGDIPVHWEVKRLNSFCDFQSGKAHEPFIDPDGEFVCVNARFISTNGLAEKRCTENLCPAKPGDVLVVMSDLPNGRALARTFLVDDQAAYAVNQRVCRIRPQVGLSGYFSYQINRNPQLLRYDDGNEQTHLPNAAFKQMHLLQPPEEEQHQIVVYLDETVSNLKKIAVQVETSIALLEEYRSALIAAAVTGEIAELR